MPNAVITTTGKNIYLARGHGTSSAKLSVFSVGTDSTAATVNDTALGAAVAISGGNTKAISSTSVDTTIIETEIRGFLDSGEANGKTLVEAGLLNTDGQLITHDVFNAFAKDSTGEITFIWKNRIS